MGSRAILALLGGLALAAVTVLAFVGGEKTAARAPSAKSERPAPRTESPELVAADSVEPADPREEVLGAPAEPATQGSLAPARLLLRVVARETRAPLAGVHVWLHEEDDEFEDSYSAWTVTSGGRVTRCVCPFTDADGRVEFEAPPGEELVLDLNVIETVSARRESVRVLPLAPGQRCPAEVTLETRDDLTWFGRVVDDATGRSLAGATAKWIASRRATAAVSADDGVIALTYASWQTIRLLDVELPGYLAARVELEGGHDGPDRAEMLRLVRPARLVARVRDGLGAPLPGLRVDVTAVEVDPSGSLTQLTPGGQITDASGTCTFEALQPRTNLAVAVRAGEGRTQRKELVLAPGETGTVDFEIGNACTVFGRAVDEQGDPVAGLDVWRLAVGDLPRLLEPGHESAVVAKARSDARGAFVLANVPAGEWWIGPAPYQSARAAPIAERLVVEGGESTRSLTLVVRDPRAITGRVTTADGSAREALVLATQGDVSVRTTAQSDGTFRLAPLYAGEWRVWARDDDTASVPMTAPAGSSKLALRLERGARLRLRATGPAGTRLESRVAWNGAPLFREALAVGTEVRTTLPAGAVQVEVVRRNTDGSETIVAEKSEVLAAGDETLVEGAVP